MYAFLIMPCLSPLDAMLSVCREHTVGVLAAMTGHVAGTASLYPAPENVEKFIRAQLYEPRYSSAIPQAYPYPANL